MENGRRHQLQLTRDGCTISGARPFLAAFVHPERGVAAVHSAALLGGTAKGYAQSAGFSLGSSARVLLVSLF